MSDQPTTGVRIAISILIALVVGLQLATVKPGKPGKYTWPILRYCMYSSSYPPGPIQTKTFDIVAVTNAGDEVPVERATMGMDSFAFNRFYRRGLLKGDPAKVNELAERMSALRDDPVVAFRVHTVTHRLIEDGVETTDQFDVFKVTDP